MKKVVFFFVVFFALNNSFGQNWLWAKGSSGSGLNGSEGTDVAIDKSGNTYITGEFNSKSIIFGTYTLTNNDTSGNTNSAFLVKYDVLGNVLWVRGLGGIGGFVGSLGQSVVTDTSGNIYITGNFDSPTITIGTYTLNNFVNGSSDIFLAKYNSGGNVIWAKRAGGGGLDQCFNVVTEISGNIYVTGRFDSPSIIFGTDTLINSTSVNGGDIFVAMYNALGNVLWAKRVGGTKNDWGNSVATDVFGNVYMSGIFNSPSITIGTFTLSNTANYNVIIVKFDSFGNVQWAKNAGSSFTPLYSISAVTADVIGNVYLTGSFSSPTITFGTNTLSNTNANKEDFFLVKYNSSGNVLWAKSSGGTGDDISYSISADVFGNISLTGGFDSPYVIFNSDTLKFPTGYTNPDPLIIIKCDSAGSTICATVLPSGGDDICGITSDAFGNTFICGDYMVSPFVIGNDTLIQTGQENVFVAKFTCGSVGINEYSYINKINAFPNPTTGVLNLTFDKTQNSKAEINITNLLGEQVKEARIKSQEARVEIDISDLQNGVYFVSVKTTEGNFTKKIIIQH